MIEISKGDGLFDLAELLLELFARPIGRLLGQTSPDHSLSLWSWADWLWLSIMLFIVVVLVRRYWRKKLEPSTVNSAETTND